MVSGDSSDMNRVPAFTLNRICPFSHPAEFCFDGVDCTTLLGILRVGCISSVLFPVLGDIPEVGRFAVCCTMQITLYCIVALWGQHFPSFMSVSPLNTTHPYPSALTEPAHSGSRRSPNPPQCLADTLAQGFPLSLHTKRPRSATFYFDLLPDKSFCLLVHLLAFWPLSPNQDADSCRNVGSRHKMVPRLPPDCLDLTRNMTNSRHNDGKSSVRASQPRSVSSVSTFLWSMIYASLTPLFTDCITPLADEQTEGVRGERGSGNLLFVNGPWWKPEWNCKTDVMPLKLLHWSANPFD